ncbi:MAG TPA: hypothetical protein VFA66_04815 [Gaiellaceae bacterium]|nr:hypothetical protein [Gaiellaceae bacterium]
MATRPGDSVPVDWFWEGAVQDVLAAWLAANGWTIRSTADTASRQRGVDVLAEKDGRTLAVEVKGYPATTYSRGDKKGLPKPSSPTTQARHWFSHALLTAAMVAPDTEVAMAFPDFPRFRGLVERSEWSLRRLGVGVYFVREDGTVDMPIPHASRAHAGFDMA